jgi:hypothetical protein
MYTNGVKGKKDIAKLEEDNLKVAQLLGQLKPPPAEKKANLVNDQLDQIADRKIDSARKRADNIVRKAGKVELVAKPTEAEDATIVTSTGKSTDKVENNFVLKQLRKKYKQSNRDLQRFDGFGGNSVQDLKTKSPVQPGKEAEAVKVAGVLNDEDYEYSHDHEDAYNYDFDHESVGLYDRVLVEPNIGEMNSPNEIRDSVVALNKILLSKEVFNEALSSV